MNTPQLPWVQRFGFERDPFLHAPARIHLDPARQEAADRAEEFIARRGFALLTGPAGCGKTLLLGHICGRLNPNAHRIIYNACPDCGPADLLRVISAGLDLEPALSRTRMTRRIGDRLAELKGVTPVLILDEAQSLPQPALETVRTVCSHGMDGHNRFAVLLSGTDDLLARLALRINDPLRQRITLYLQLSPLSRDSTRDYLRNRLEQAGGQLDTLVGADALNLIFDVTAGVPRRIDKLTAEAFRFAAREQACSVALSHVQDAVRIVFGPRSEHQP